MQIENNVVKRSLYKAETKVGEVYTLGEEEDVYLRTELYFVNLETGGMTSFDSVGAGRNFIHRPDAKVVL